MYTNDRNREINPTPMEAPRNIRPNSPDPLMVDNMGRRVEVCDIIFYIVGGYRKVLNYAKIVQVSPERGFIRILKNNGTVTSLWNIHEAVIIARVGHYDMIPEPFRTRLQI